MELLKAGAVFVDVGVSWLGRGWFWCDGGICRADGDASCFLGRILSHKTNYVRTRTGEALEYDGDLQRRFW